MRSRAENRLDTVQILRALAATMIVLGHAQTFVAVQAEARGLSFAPLSGFPFAVGVDLFFAISGFIIVFASERFFAAPQGGLEFLRRRVCRIVPLWWLALSLRIAALSAVGVAGIKAFPSLRAVAASYLFIPFDGMGYGPHFPFPVLDLGWSLNYEMLFYALFACTMWLPRLAASLAVNAVLLVGVLVVWLHPPQGTVLWFWFQPIVLEFSLGVGVALLYRAGLRLGPLARLALLAAGLALWLGVDLARLGAEPGPGQYGWPRLVVWGGGATLILAAAVLGETEVRLRALRQLARFGDSSYALYLLHPFVILAFRAVASALPLTEAALWPLTLLIVATAVLVTEPFHRTVEKPLVDRLQRMRLPWWQGGAGRIPGTG